MPFIHNTNLNPEQVFLRSNEYSILNNGTKKSSISFNLKNTIKIPRNVDAYIQLNSFKFMNAFYNVNSTNNQFYFSLNGGGENINTIFNIAIPIGNYTITSILTYLNTELASYITITYDSTVFKVTCTSSLHTFIIRSGLNNCLKLLGFSDSTNEASTVTSANLVNLAGTQILYITLGNIIVQSNSSANSLIGNVLESINIDVLGGSSKSYYNGSNVKYKISEDFISFIDINIFDENNNLVDFNNTDWYMSISFIFSYKNEYKAPQSIDLIGNEIAEVPEETTIID